MDTPNKDEKRCYICQPNKYTFTPGGIVPVCEKHMNRPSQPKEVNINPITCPEKYENSDRHWCREDCSVCSTLKEDKKPSDWREEDEIAEAKQDGIRIGRKLGYSAAIAEIEEKVKKAYGSVSKPALVIIESFEGHNEQRPGLEEILSLLSAMKK